MSNFLAIDTSSRYLTVLAQKGEKRVLRSLSDCAMQHSVMLMGEIDAALTQAELTPVECDFFAAVTGPGSFTGIRIGISAAKGFALATGKKLVPVTSFDLFAYNVNDNNFHVVIDAAHGYFYVCGYGAQREITAQPCYLSFEETKKLNTPLYGFEDLEFENYTKLNPAECLAAAVLEKSKVECGQMHALYVRKSQAEEMRK